MIQRIQSIYLLLGAIALILFGILGVPAPSQLGAYPWLSYALLALASLGALIGLGAIFLYTNRPKQLQVVGLAQWTVLLLVVVLAATFFFVPTLQQTASDAVALVGYLLVFVGYVFIRLAAGAIRRDIALVRSMDRLR